MTSLNLNPFRLTVIGIVGFISWLIFFRGNDQGLLRSRRSPVPTVDDVPDACLNNGQIAVTFDEGPSSRTLKVLDSLAIADVKATFHVVTKYLTNINISTNMRSAYERGHLIGLRFPTEKVPMSMSDLEIKQTLLVESFKIYMQIGEYPKYLRLPADGYDNRVLSIASSLGFIVTSWNIDTFDYVSEVSAADINDAYLSQLNLVGQGQGRFISLHRDLYDVYSDETIMVKIKASAVAKGYNFVTLDQCLGSSAYRSDNNDPTGQVDENFVENTLFGRNGSKNTTTSQPDPTTSAKTSDASSMSIMNIPAMIITISVVIFNWIIL